MSHTPGPWTLETVKTSVGVCHKVGEFPSRGTRPTTYACIYEDGSSGWRLLERGDFSGSELYANARLVAAAPDLLASAKEFVALYDGLRDSIGKSVSEKLERAEAAIAKAEGR